MTNLPHPDRVSPMLLNRVRHFIGGAGHRDDLKSRLGPREGSTTRMPTPGLSTSAFASKGL